MNENGHPDPRSLSVPGWRRAGALVRYFGHPTNAVDGPIWRPRHIVAARPTDRHFSTRPADTVRTLADSLNLTVNERWSDRDTPQQIARALRSLDGPVLVCWRHDQLPQLARALLEDDRVPSYWPANRFDVTWSIFARETTWTFEQIPQLLLPGDLQQTITGE